MPIKQFNCEYYQLTLLAPNGREPLFDLTRWIDRINVVDYQDNTRDYKEDRVRIEEIYYHPTYDKWFLRFMRLRSNDVPSLTREHEASDFMELGDRYVSEDVSCLYDPTCNVLMIQKNSHSVSPIGIQKYLNETWVPEEVITLRKVVAHNTFEKVRNSKRCRRIVVRVADVPTLQRGGFLDRLRSPVGNAIRAMNNYEMPFVELNFSVGRDRYGDLGNDLLQPILRDIEENPMVFDKAQVQILQENETKSEFIDLFTDSAKDIISFQVERNQPIRFDAMIDRLATKYCPGENRENRRAYILRCINQN